GPVRAVDDSDAKVDHAPWRHINSFSLQHFRLKTEHRATVTTQRGTMPCPRSPPGSFRACDQACDTGSPESPAPQEPCRSRTMSVPTDPPCPLTCPASELTSRPVRWLWPERLARGKLSILVGDPGLGKSLVTLDLAARLSTGRGWPDGAAMEAAEAV